MSLKGTGAAHPCGPGCSAQAGRSRRSRICCAAFPQPRTSSTSISSCPSVAQATSLLPLHRALPVALQGNISKQNWNGFSGCECKPWPGTLQLIPAQGLLRWSCCQQQLCGQINSACSAVVVPAAVPAGNAQSSHKTLGAAPAWSRGPSTSHHLCHSSCAIPSASRLLKGSSCPRISEMPFSPTQKLYLLDKNNAQAWSELICKVLGRD